jgi:hypothetical protein
MALAQTAAISRNENPVERTGKFRSANVQQAAIPNKKPGGILWIAWLSALC